MLQGTGAQELPHFAPKLPGVQLLCVWPVRQHYAGKLPGGNDFKAPWDTFHRRHLR